MATEPSDVTILHVDDNEGFADMVATFLEREQSSFDVTTATSANDGRTRLEESSFDCIVSDYQMPDENGIEFLEDVRKDRPDLPFILFTGKGSEEIASDAISAGVTDYLQKGSSKSQYTVLANRIANAVQNYRNQQALRERELRLNLFFENSPLGIIEWNDEFEYIRTNDAAQTILGYQEDELWGESWEITVPESEREHVRAHLEELLETKDGNRSVNPNVRKDGEYIICEWHNQVVTDANDEVVAIFSLFQDVTDQERKERELERLIDSVPGVVYRCANTEGWPMERLRGDVQSLFGYTAEALEDRAAFYGEEVIHPDDREDVWEAVQTALDAEEAFQITYRVRTKDGETKRVWERGQGVPGINGDLEAIEGFITEFGRWNTT